MKIRLCGSVKCGFPVPSGEEHEEHLDLNKLLMPHYASTFCLRASGSSMEPFILSGDIVIVDKALKPVAGDIVVAEVDGNFTLKNLAQKNGKFMLTAENPKWDDIYAQEELSIFGVVTSVIRRIKNENVRTSRL